MTPSLLLAVFLSQMDIEAATVFKPITPEPPPRVCKITPKERKECAAIAPDRFPVMWGKNCEFRCDRPKKVK